ncbi:hypothetical protein FDUTEX481_08070 [Tolypothrix sp. PCC 7601]|nr:hypothetical protein FDUTEX481_08070 [Tolypothrix sp. PCC 7601]
MICQSNVTEITMKRRSHDLYCVASQFAFFEDCIAIRIISWLSTP